MVDECDGDEDSIREEEDEVSSDEADYDPADGDYVDDGESMGDDESYDGVGGEGRAVGGSRFFPLVERATGSVNMSDLSKQRARMKSVQVN